MSVSRCSTAYDLEKQYSSINYCNWLKSSTRKGSGYAVSKLTFLGRWGKMNKYTYRDYSRVPFTMIES